MIDLLGPSGTVTMSDVMVTIAAFMAGWVRYAQKAKDEQIKDLNDTIKYLREELKNLREERSVINIKGDNVTF